MLDSLQGRQGVQTMRSPFALSELVVNRNRADLIRACHCACSRLHAASVRLLHRCRSRCSCLDRSLGDVQLEPHKVRQATLVVAYLQQALASVECHLGQRSSSQSSLGIYGGGSRRACCCLCN